MNRIIVDTNIIVGLYDKKDIYHFQAQELMRKFKEESRELILLDCVVNETFTVLARRFIEHKNQRLIASAFRKVKTDLPKNKILSAYLLLLTNYDEIIERMIVSEGRLNFHDSLITTFALKQKINFIASFDRDFDEISGVARIFE